jgi:hypothetical protein
MCCGERIAHHPPMGLHSFEGCCGPHGHHYRSAQEEKEMLESLKRDLEDEISRVEARIKKIKT